MNLSEFKAEYNKRTEYVEGILRENCPAEEKFSKTIKEASEYALLSGGKRLRPQFMMAAFELFSKDEDRKTLTKFMTAIECIHSYSLVHDDLPGMDNDELRRGKPTTWKAYGEGMGILAGDALLNLAFETMSEAVVDSKDPVSSAKAMKVIANKAGIYGMIGGQCADLEAEEKGNKVSSECLEYIHEHKTSALIEAAFMAGGILGGCSEEQAVTLEKIGSHLGMAFQIRDDILDVTGDTAKLGKKTGSDAANDKTTYVTFYGLEKSRQDVDIYSGKAKELLNTLPGDKAFLNMLIESLINREN